MTPEEKRARLIEAARALLEAAPGNRLNTVSLNKALFYLDLVSLRDRGDTFTKSSYIALPQGPVVAKYPERLIRPLKEEGVAEQRSEGQANPVVLLSRLPFLLATKDVLDIAKKVALWCAKNSSANVSDYSHDNPGWLIARADEQHASGVKQVIDMHIAMQQIVDADPWMNDPLGDAGVTACNNADSLKGNCW